MACVQHSVEGYFVPGPTAEDIGEAPYLWQAVPTTQLPPSASLTLARMRTLRLAAGCMAVYFVVVMAMERSAEYLGSAVRRVSTTQTNLHVVQR